MDDMTEDELARLEALANAATNGPWEAEDEDRRGFVLATVGKNPYPTTIAAVWTYTDTIFIATARTAVPELIAEVRRMRKWMDHMLANEADGTSSGAPLELRGYKIVPGDGDNLVVLERGELAEVERLSALLGRCWSYVRHAESCPYDPSAEAENPCECGLDPLAVEINREIESFARYGLAKAGGE